MFQSSGSRRIGTVVALVISWCAAYWLFSLLPVRHDAFFRVGFVCSVLCALGAFSVSWGVCLSYIAEWRKWSPRACHKSGISVLVPLAILCALIPHERFLIAFDWTGCLLLVSGYVCGRLAHPELTDEEAYAPEPPLTLFPK